jgi:hypothetical protein
MKNKNYNPFKMIGSYIGALVFLILDVIRVNLIVQGNPSTIIKYLFYPIIPLYNALIKIDYSNIAIVVIYGFIIGYLINVLIRKYIIK